jgi:hypothetical protein
MMKYATVPSLARAVVLILATFTSAPATAAGRPPYVVLILAVDLGYSDVGA